MPAAGASELNRRTAASNFAGSSPWSYTADNRFEEFTTLVTKLSRILGTPNWRYAFGEVALIFVGITLALFANSWYEDRSDRAEEAEILRQIVASLALDIESLEARSSAISTKLEHLHELKSHIEKDLPYTPRLDRAFAEVMTGGAARLSTAAFETLVFRGIDVISDPALRNQLVEYYDSARSRLDRRNDLDSRDSWAAEPYFKRNFRWDSDDLSVAPLEYEALIADPEFLNILAIRIWTHERLARQIHQQIAEEAAELRESIIDHLEAI